MNIFIHITHLDILNNNKNTITRYVNTNIPGILVKKKLDQSMLINETVCLYGDLCKPFLTWKSCINKQKRQNNHYIKNYINKLHVKAV